MPSKLPARGGTDWQRAQGGVVVIVAAVVVAVVIVARSGGGGGRGYRPPRELR
jgi:hypothetical protein